MTKQTMNSFALAMSLLALALIPATVSAQAGLASELPGRSQPATSRPIVQEQNAAKRPTYTVLYTFTGEADGANPSAGLIRDAAGNLYGTASQGGLTTGCEFGSAGCGVLFKLDRKDNETALYSFTGYPTDGEFPVAGLVRDKEGNLYGSTKFGGTYDVGTVFRVDRNGKETVLYSFTGGADGANPLAGLVLDKAGNLYGTAPYGGDLSCTLQGPYGCGVVFRIDGTGHETVLYTFTGGADGGFPTAGLIWDQRGNLYGTTEFGGLASCSCGVVFKLDLAGKETVLYSFTGGADGAYPFAGLVLNKAGNLYGTTSYGGDLNCAPLPGLGCGNVFKLKPNGKETALYNFTGGADGFSPVAGVVQDCKGNVYGTASAGGDLSCASGQGFGCGVVFKLKPNGRETVLYTFSGGSDGGFPAAGLIWDGKGNLYSTTSQGGDLGSSNPSCSVIGCGVVFKLTH
jgi:uncharacterized repeat protein (TIGR03803 family)